MNQLKPYEMLKNILTDGEEIILTDRAQKNINELLDVKDKNVVEKELHVYQKSNILTKIKNFFLKIDNYIFIKKSRKWNTLYIKR